MRYKRILFSLISEWTLPKSNKNSLWPEECRNGSFRKNGGILFISLSVSIRRSIVDRSRVSSLRISVFDHRDSQQDFEINLEFVGKACLIIKECSQNERWNKRTCTYFSYLPFTLNLSWNQQIHKGFKGQLLTNGLPRRRSEQSLVSTF